MNSIDQINLKLPSIETEHLLIRQFQMQDLNAIHDVLDSQLGDANPIEVRKKWLEWSVLNYQHLEELYQIPSGDRAVVLKQTGECIGACGFAPNIIPYGLLPAFQPPVETPENALLSIEWGLYYALSPLHQRNGYATEASRALIDYAFTQLRLRRIVATTTHENKASRAVMERLGMQIHTNPYSQPGWFQVVGILDNPYKAK